MPADVTARPGMLLAWIGALDQPILGGEPSTVTDRLIAVTCAMHLARPDVVSSGANVGDVSKYLKHFGDWLDEATDDSDRQFRRVLLVLACDKAAIATTWDRIGPFLKAVYKARH